MGGATVGAMVYVCLPGWDPWVRDAMFERAIAFLKRRRPSVGVVSCSPLAATSSELMEIVQPIVAGRHT